MSLRADPFQRRKPVLAAIIPSSGQIFVFLSLSLLPGPIFFVGAAPAQQPAMSKAQADQPGKCSVAKDEVIKIASWNIKNLPYQTRKDTGAFEDFVAMVRKIDADILALQEVTPQADEVMELASALQKNSRCHNVLLSEETDGEKYGLLYDASEVDLFYPTGPTNVCEAGKEVRFQDNSPLMTQLPVTTEDGQPSHVSYFRVRGGGPNEDSAFDFAVINAHVKQGGAGLDQLAQDFAGLDQNYPWLADERDRILLGDLGIAANPGELRGNYFPQMKPLINPLLIINLGLSDISFDDAVAGMRPGGNGSDGESSAQHFDNIVVRRLDRPGTCGSALYCGGLGKNSSMRESIAMTRL